MTLTEQNSTKLMKAPNLIDCHASEVSFHTVGNSSFHGLHKRPHLKDETYGFDQYPLNRLLCHTTGSTWYVTKEGKIEIKYV